MAPRRTGFRSLVLPGLFVGAAWALEASEITEYRGLWVDSWGEGFKTETQVNNLVENARAAGFNMLLPQIRKRGEVYYNSSLEPRAQELAADFDPLRYLIERAHAAEPPLQVHPWIVVYPVWNNFRRPPDQPGHIYNRHPEWLTRNASGDTWDGSGYNFDPGHPAVQQHFFDLVMEILRDYPVDGVHLDYIRYRGPEWGYNPAAVARFNRLHQREGLPAQTNAEWQQFRRDQVTALVRRIYAGAAAVRPEAVVSAATITWAPGPETLDQWPRSAAHSRVFQEWPDWMKEGILDLNMPMAYFDQMRYGLAWQRWTNFIKENQHDRHTAIGVGFFSNTIRSSLLQIEDARKPGPDGGIVHGVAGFSSRSSNNEGRPPWALFYALRAGENNVPGPFRQTAAVPEMTWKTNPVNGHLLAQLPVDAEGGHDGRPFRLRGEGILQSTVSDAMGHVIFVNLPPGEYELSALDQPFEPLTVRVDAGRVTQLTIGEPVEAVELLESIPGGTP